jgi:pyruvate dehydrogenase E1 component alpha subunit
VAAFTAAESVTAGHGVVARAESCGVPGVTVDGNDVLAIEETARDLVASIRCGEGPRLLHARTYRLLGHTSTDPAAWRRAEDVEAARGREPLTRFAKLLQERGATEDALGAIRKQAMDEMVKARERARAAPWPETAVAFDDVQDVGAVAWAR